MLGNMSVILDPLFASYVILESTRKIREHLRAICAILARTVRATVLLCAMHARWARMQTRQALVTVLSAAMALTRTQAG